MSEKVFLGLSGGVDSSVSAALLVEQGYDVTGVYMKNWSKDLPGMKCPWAEDLADAKRVAVRLGIDFKVFDFESDYKQKVVDYMVTEYKSGRTPNPDIMCNQEIKFRLFFETAKEQGADLVATGHYAKTSNGKLFLAEDKNKDQTYFLYRVKEAALEKTLFPIGNLKKSEVRELAKKYDLTTANKKDSQGICFIGSVGIKEFLKEYVETAPGEIIDEQSGDVLGYHDGAIFYTIGQRHGLNIGGGLPFYVSRKDMLTNIVYVTANINNEKLWNKNVSLTSLSMIDDSPLNSGDYLVRVRHQAPLTKARIEAIGDSELIVRFDDEQRTISPGQSVVIYKDQVCLGGGIVK